MRVVLCGSRDWTDLGPIERALKALLARYGREDLWLLHGAAQGADSCVDIVARHLGLGAHVQRFPAHWRHARDCPPDCPRMIGRVAGPIRNRLMLETRPDLVLAFHRDLGTSRGTKDTVQEALRRGIPVQVIEG